MSAYPAVGAYDRRAAPSGSGPAAMYPRVAHPVPSASPFSGGGGTSHHMPVMTAVGAGAPSGGLGGVGGMGGMGGHGASGGAPGLAAGPAPIAVSIKTQLRVAQPPPLAPVQAVTVSAAAFDFDVEKQLLSEASALHQRTSVAVKREVDPRASKYTQMGMNREAVIMALAIHGDSHSQVVDFCNAYTLLREMGFDPVAVAGCLALCGNDPSRVVNPGSHRKTSSMHLSMTPHSTPRCLFPRTTRRPLVTSPAGALPSPSLSTPLQLGPPTSPVSPHLPAHLHTSRPLVPRQDAVRPFPRRPAPSPLTPSSAALPPFQHRTASSHLHTPSPLVTPFNAIIPPHHPFTTHSFASHHAPKSPALCFTPSLRAPSATFPPCIPPTLGDLHSLPPATLRPPTCRALSPSGIPSLQLAHRTFEAPQMSSALPLTTLTLPSPRSEKLAEMGGGLGGETRIFARGQTIFWRLLQLATAIIALAVMTASNANGMYFQYYQAFIFMVAAMTAVAAWCLAHLLHSIGRLMSRKWRITLFVLLDFLVAWIALAGASAAAGLTSFADKGSGMVQPGYCQMGLFSSFCARTKAATAFEAPQYMPYCSYLLHPPLAPCMQMGLFSSFCARTKAATAMAFITFFVLIPSLVASATRAVVTWFED
ncbi:unnamed protein product [Closterium sp. Naga37s-1]|nr:unnamed protein product [Closterium sp. Naga37s-1]